MNRILGRWMGAVALVCIAAAVQGMGPVRAAETLTPEEIAEGWVLLFDGESTFGWKTEGDVSVKEGLLHVGGEKPGAVELTTPLGSGELYVETVAGGGGGSLSFTEKNSQMGWAISAEKPSRHLHTVLVNQEESDLGDLNEETEGDRLVCTSAVNCHDPTFRLSIEHRPANAADVKSMQLKAVRFRPLKLVPIFNGKDLTGWKPIPGKASKFAVTEGGELSIKDGNGDLQTEAEWDDFVLQLEIKANGTHLNSGVFFRALVGQFWSGYESQIRNQWEGDDRTKPVDFGTGGIYNQQPARRVISSDNEWFTKTIIATGNHIAVWVNGIQVSDFTDNRPPRESARRGSKTSPGVISLQGHDPTTDLSFRNIRIAPLSRPGT